MINATELKAYMIGEHSFTIERLDEDGDPYIEKHFVPWATIKEILSRYEAFQNEND